MSIPIFGDLCDCRWEFHWSTIKEMFVTFAFSMLPLWLSAVFIYNSSDASSVGNAVVANISNGELLIYCNSIIAPIFYMALEESHYYRTFPSKGTHLFVFVIVMVLSGAYFAFYKIGIKFNSASIVPFSVGILLVSLFIRYSSGTINRSRKDPAALMSAQTGSFVDQYRDHRRAR